MKPPAFYQTDLDAVEAALEQLLPPETSLPVSIHKAMRYSVFAGGKRIRPALCIETARMFTDDLQGAVQVGCALEFIHTYSLIHDDLPALDNDDLRRGKPTNHKVFGEAIAILAGDALLTQAFHVLADAGATRLAAADRLRIIAEIAEAAGSRGMVGGQVMDILAEGHEIDCPTLASLHARKTGALIRASVRVGGIAGGAVAEQLQALTRYAERVGLAFQIVDDILDIEGVTAEMGKTAGSDLRRKKATYPAVLGLEESRRQAARLLEEAKEALRPLREKGGLLSELADFVGRRRH